MITDAWLNGAAEERAPTASPPSDSPTLIGRGKEAREEPRRSSTRQKANRNGNTGVELNHGAGGHAPRETNAPQHRRCNDVHLRRHPSWWFRRRQRQDTSRQFLHSAGVYDDTGSVYWYSITCMCPTFTLTADFNQLNHPFMVNNRKTDF